MIRPAMRGCSLLITACLLTSAAHGAPPGSGDSPGSEGASEQRARAALERAIDQAVREALLAEASRRDPLPKGTVRFSLRDADLATEFIPIFEQQVGVTIRYDGPPKKTTLIFHEPVPWSEALSLLAQFTNTHVSQNAAGEIRLKGRWGGTLPEKAPPKPTRPPHVGRPSVPTISIGGRRGTPKYNPPKFRPPKYNPPRFRPPKYNPPKFRPPKYNPPKFRPPKYNPPKFRPPKFRPPRFNPQ